MNLFDRVRAALADRYAVTRELGRGGAAVVFLADDRKHRRPVALKVLRPELATMLGPDRFMREVEIAARLTHPHILPLYDSGEADGILYFAMPYMPGETVRSLLTREGPLPQEVVIRFAREILEALAYAHAQGVVHRDIKPENILLGDGHPIIADFGIAKAISAATEAPGITTAGLALGTPAYMSPEQAAGSETIDGRSDLYSLGCVLFEMCTGRPPFQGPTAQAIVGQHFSDPAPALEEFRADLTASLTGAVATALEKDPRCRFATATAFSRAIVSPATVAVRPRRRVWLAGAGAALLAATAAAVVPWGAPRVKPQELPLDANRIVVYPFGALGDLPRPSSLNEGVATALQIALNGTASKRAIDGYQLLGEASRTRARPPEPSEAARVARRSRARFFVSGTMLQREPPLFYIELHDLERDSTLNFTVSGATVDGPWTLGFKAARAMLPTLITPGEPIDVSEGLSRNPAALARFLEGEQAYRRARFQDALRAYGRAIRADSGFGLAALRAAETAHWLERTPEAQSLVDLALRDTLALPQRQVALARAWQAYFAGQADSAAGRFRSSVALDSAWADAWMGLGEVYTHLLPADFPLDSLAESAFDQVHRLAPAFAPAIVHLMEFAARRGDGGKAQSLLEAFRRGNPDEEDLVTARLAIDCVRGRVTSEEWRRAAATTPDAVLQAAAALTRGGLRQPGCSRAAWEALLAADTATGDQGANRRFAALVTLQSQLAGLGLTDDLRGLFAADTTVDPTYHDHLFLLDAIAEVASLPEADSAAARIRKTYRTKLDKTGAVVRWLLGSWDATHGELTEAEELAQSLDSTASRDGGRLDSRFARSLGARVALARGDTVKAMTMLMTLTPDGPLGAIEWTPWESLGAEWMLLAELAILRGSPQQGLDIGSRLDAPAPMIYPLYLRRSLELRLHAATLLGDNRLQSQLRRRLERLIPGGASSPPMYGP